MSTAEQHDAAWPPKRRPPELKRTVAALDFAKRLASGRPVSDFDRLRLRRAGLTDREVAEIVAAIRGERPAHAGSGARHEPPAIC